MRITLLTTSARVAPGLLTRSAWKALEAADRVVTTDPATAEALRAEGVPVEVAMDALEALEPASDDRSVVVVLDADDPSVRPLDEVGRLTASYDLPGARLLDLVTVMDRLRSGCPWDREQSHRSLVRYLLEETHETIEAIESGDLAHLREELGDLLLQVVFHARIAAETSPADGGFDIDDVARGIADKLVYRHPHVFAGLDVADAEEVDRNWEALKAAEKQRSSPLDGVPAALPALAYAEKVLGRLGRAGLLDLPLPAGDAPGDRLLRLVAEARESGLDPEQELRDAVRRLIARVAAD